MLGSFRFLLAWFVMLSHLPNSPFAKNFNLAVSAVIMFYFISGYLMYKSFKFKGNFFKSAKIFYLKRILRLFPLYLIVLFATILAISIFGKSELVPLLNQDLDAKKIFLNSILILNNYVFCPFEIDALLPHPLIPPTWSLSTEWHFYLLVPFLFFLINNKKWIFYLIFFL
jgi:peptidoglycan/LPS O-acetylase OafA/YrhL